MSKLYDLLEEAPQTENPYGKGIRGHLNFEERADLRIIKGAGSSTGRTNSPKEQFTPVYYLVGDEDRAADRFVKENQDLLEQIDFSKRNVLGDTLDREIYDLVLHHLGERVRAVYPSVVHEKRPNGREWIIPRDHYESNPVRRYHRKHSALVPADMDLATIYETGPPIIDLDYLTSQELEGKLINILHYFCEIEEIDCTPITTDEDEPAVQKK